MDSDGNINNPHKKLFKRTSALSAEDIHHGIKTPSSSATAAATSEADAINALAEEVVSLAKPKSPDVSSSAEPKSFDPNSSAEMGSPSADSFTEANFPNTDSPVEADSPDLSPSAEATGELYPESPDSLSDSTEEPFEFPKPTSEPFSPELIDSAEPLSSEPIESTDLSSTEPIEPTEPITPAPAELVEPVAPAELISESSELISEPAPMPESAPVPDPVLESAIEPESIPEPALETIQEPLSDVDTVVVPEPVLASDAPVAPASLPEPVTVNFQPSSAPAASSPAAPVSIPVAPAPVAPPTPQPADATVSQGIVNTPPKKSPVTTILIIVFVLILLAGLGFLIYVIIFEPKMNNQNLEPTATPTSVAPVDQSLVCIVSSAPKKPSDETTPNETYTSSYQKISLNYHDSSLQDLLTEDSYSYDTYADANTKISTLDTAYTSSLEKAGLTLDPFYSSFLVDPASESSNPDTEYSATESHYVTSDELTAKNSVLINFPLTSSKALVTDLSSVESAYSDLGYTCKTSNKLLTLIPDDLKANDTNKTDKTSR